MSAGGATFSPVHVVVGGFWQTHPISFFFFVGILLSGMHSKPSPCLLCSVTHTPPVNARPELSRLVYDDNKIHKNNSTTLQLDEEEIQGKYEIHLGRKALYWQLLLLLVKSVQCLVDALRPWVFSSWLAVSHQKCKLQISSFYNYWPDKELLLQYLCFSLHL